MPSLFHDITVDLVESELAYEIKWAAQRLRSSGSATLATELEKVYKGRSTSIELSTSRSKSSVPKRRKVWKRKEMTRRRGTAVRCPDSSFCRTSSTDRGSCCADSMSDPAQLILPMTVLEVGFSQQRTYTDGSLVSQAAMRVSDAMVALNYVSFV